MSFVLIKDATFVRADTSPSATPGSVGDGWIDVTGSVWEINSNLAKAPSFGSLYGGVLVRPVGEAFADGKVRFYPGGSQTGDRAAMAVARYQDASNYLGAFTYGVGGSTQMTIFTVVSGSGSQIKTDTGMTFPAANAWYVEFQVVANALTFTLFATADDSIIHTMTINSSAILASGQWGIESYNNCPFTEVIGYQVPGAFTPGTISKTSDTTSSVTLTASDASGGVPSYTYQWHRSLVSGFTPGPTTALSGKTTRNLTDTGLASGQTYYYVMAYADSTSPTPQAAYTSQFQEVIPQAAPVVMGFIGDSITFGVGPAHLAAPPTQEILMLNKTGVVSSLYTAVNDGVSGATTGDWIADSTNLNTAITDFTNGSVTVISVMLGTNDSKIAVATSKSDYIANIQSMITALKTAGFTRFILNCPPYVAGDPAVWDINTSNALLLQYRDANAAIAAADPNHVSVGDTLAYSWFQNNPTQLTDGVHPTDDGAVSLGYLWAQGYEQFGSAAPVPSGPVVDLRR